MCERALYDTLCAFLRMEKVGGGKFYGCHVQRVKNIPPLPSCKYMQFLVQKGKQLSIIASIAMATLCLRGLLQDGANTPLRQYLVAAQCKC